MPDIRLPSGTILKNVPDNVSKDEIKAKAIASGLATEADFGVPNQGPVAGEPIDAPTPELIDPNAPNSPARGQSGTMFEALFPPSVTEPVTGVAADLAQSFIEQPASTAGQIAGTVIPQARIGRILVGTLAGTAGSEIEQALDINPRNRNFVSNLGVNAAEVLGGEAAAKMAQKLIKRTTGVDIAAGETIERTTTPVAIDTGTGLGEVTAREAAERQGVQLLPQEAFEAGAEAYNPDLSNAIQYSVTQALKKKPTGEVPIIKRANEFNDKLNNLIVGQKYTKSSEIAPKFKEAVDGTLRRTRADLDVLENTLAKMAETERAIIPMDRGIMDYVIENKGNLRSAFGTKGYNELIDIMSDMMQGPSSNTREWVSAYNFDNTYNRLLDLADNDPQRLAVLFKTIDDAGSDGLLTTMVKYAENSGTEYGLKRGAYHEARNALRAMDNDGVFKALQSGNPDKLDQIFRNEASFDAVQQMLGDTISPEVLETAARARLFEKISNADQSISSAKFRTAMKDFSPQVMQRVLGQKGYQDLVDAQVLNLASNDSELVKVVKAMSGQMDMQDVRALLDASARATGIAPLASLQGGIAVMGRKIRQFLGVDKRAWERLAGPKAMAEFDKFSQIQLSDPNAYKLYSNLMRELGVKPLTEEQFQGKIQTPMYEVMGAPKPEAE